MSRLTRIGVVMMTIRRLMTGDLVRCLAMQRLSRVDHRHSDTAYLHIDSVTCVIVKVSFANIIKIMPKLYYLSP